MGFESFGVVADGNEVSAQFLWYELEIATKNGIEHTGEASGNGIDLVVEVHIFGAQFPAHDVGHATGKLVQLGLGNDWPCLKVPLANHGGGVLRHFFGGNF